MESLATQRLSARANEAILVQKGTYFGTTGNGKDLLEVG